MAQPATNARIVLTTAATPEEARTIALALVDEGLAACASIIPAVESVYRWQGKLECTGETMLLLKTGMEQLERLEQRLHGLHSYEVPEFLVVPLEAGSAGYLSWLADNLRTP